MSRTIVEGGSGLFAALRVKESVGHRLRAKKQVNQVGIVDQGAKQVQGGGTD
jgi:hypothetical protein